MLFRIMINTTKLLLKKKSFIIMGIIAPAIVIVFFSFAFGKDMNYKIGIIDKDIDKVFNKGFTGHNGRILGKSTGIGLYLCKKLCRKLGLNITLTSKYEQGTKVNIIFPLGDLTSIRQI